MRIIARQALLYALPIAASACTIYETPVEYSGSVTATVEPEYVMVNQPPPPVQETVEVVPAKPHADAIWVAGHFEWRGSWIWIAGSWGMPPEPGCVWEDPVYVRVDNGYRYHPGYWRPPHRQPAPV